MDLIWCLLYTVPTITNKSKRRVTIFEGNVLYLVCDTEGYPTPSVTWKKNGKVLQTNITRSDFIIDDTSEKDAGKYECEAVNSVGTVRYTVKVAIKGIVTRNLKKCIHTIFKVATRICVKEIAKRLLRHFCSRKTVEFLRIVQLRQ